MRLYQRGLVKLGGLVSVGSVKSDSKVRRDSPRSGVPSDLRAPLFIPRMQDYFSLDIVARQRSIDLPESIRRKYPSDAAYLRTSGPQ